MSIVINVSFHTQPSLQIKLFSNSLPFDPQFGRHVHIIYLRLAERGEVLSELICHGGY